MHVLGVGPFLLNFFDPKSKNTAAVARTTDMELYVPAVSLPPAVVYRFCVEEAEMLKTLGLD